MWNHPLLERRGTIGLSIRQINHYMEENKCPEEVKRPEINEKYKKIIDFPHHVSKNHPQMSMHQRASQFAAFAALSGHKEALKESEERFAKDPSDDREPIYDEPY